MVGADKKFVSKLCRDFKIHAGEAKAHSFELKKQLPFAVDELLKIKACKILNIKITTAIHFLVAITENGKN